MRLVLVMVTIAALTACAGSGAKELPEDFNPTFEF